MLANVWTIGENFVRSDCASSKTGVFGSVIRVSFSKAGAGKVLRELEWPECLY